MGRLPLELIIHILDLLCFNEAGFPDRKTMRSCCLVCSAWRELAQPLLFRVVSPDTASQLSFITASAFQDNEGRNLGFYVQTLEIRVGGRNAFDPGDFVKLISYLPRLYELDIFTSMTAFSDTIVTRLRDMKHYGSNPSIGSLRWNSSVSDSSILYQLLSIWPTVKSLYLVHAFTLLPPCERPLFELFMLGYHFAPSQEVLDWLVPTNTLRIIAFPTYASLIGHELLDRTGDSIRCIRLLDTLNSVNSKLLYQCPNLEEIQIWDLAKRLDMGAVDMIPKTVKHLRIRRWCELTSLKIIVRTLKLLRTITLPTSLRTRMSQDEVRELEDHCLMNGITMVFDPLSPYASDHPMVIPSI